MKRIALTFVFLTVLSYQTSVFSQDGKDAKEKSMPFLIEEKKLPEMSFANNKLSIKNATIGSKVVVTSLIGNKVREFKITSSDFEQVLDLKRGIYIFNMQSNTYSITKKGIVR